VEAAPPGIQTVIVDYPIDEVSIEALEKRVRDKLPESCIIVAESFSGPIGVRVSADPRVRALVLCNSFIRSPLWPLLRHVPLAALFAIPIPKFVLRFVLVGSSASASLLEKTQLAIRRVPPDVLAARVRQVLRTNEEATVRALYKPIFYLRGLGDNLVAKKAVEDLHRVRPDAKIVTIEGPHMLLQRSPRECWKVIGTFIEQSAG
jgi:pimeloyl-ACP methyl ester carboxylesterase